MKQSFILPTLLCILFTSCDTDIEKKLVKPTSEVPAPLLKSEGFTNIIINETNINLFPIVLNWTKSDFGEDIIVEYSLEMAENASFTKSLTVTVGNNTYSKAISSADLNKWVINNFNGLDANGLPLKVNLLMRISATIALENPTVTIPPDKVFSNTISLTVVPYSIVTTASLPL